MPARLRHLGPVLAALCLIGLGACARPSAASRCLAEDDAALCTAAGAECGEASVRDRCGTTRLLQCGSCPTGSFCGETGVANRCGCRAESDYAFCRRNAVECGRLSAADNCGLDRTVDCGACASPTVCGGAGAPGQCGVPCAAEPDAVVCSRLGAECGEATTTNVCGASQTVRCGDCPEGQACAESSPRRCIGCVPESDGALCAARRANCGTLEAQDSCGAQRIVDCGGCPADQICGSAKPHVCGTASALLCDAAGWCWMSPQPQGADLTGVWGTSPDDVWMTTDEGTLLHWDGTRWALTDLGTGERLNGIWGSSASNLWAFGRNTLRRSAGTTWTSIPIPDGIDIVALWAAAPNDAWFVANPVGAPYYPESTLFHWNGSTLARQKTQMHAQAIWGSSSNDLWVGGYPLNESTAVLIHWNGNAWTEALNEGFEVTALRGTGPSDAWACRSDATLHWDGAAWAVASQKPCHTLAGDGSERFALTKDTRTSAAVLMRWANGKWHDLTSFAGLAALHAFSDTAVWTVGGGGEISVWDGAQLVSRTWRSTSRPVTGIVAGPGDTVWIGNPTVDRWSGTSWTATRPQGQDLVRLSGDAGGLWGLAARLMRWDATAGWATIQLDVALQAIGGGNANGFWSVATTSEEWEADLTIAHRELDGSWTSAGTLPYWASTNAIAASGSSNVWVVGDKGDAYRFDGRGWHDANFPGPASLKSVLPFATETWVAGVLAPYGPSIASGIIARWDGATWTQPARAFPPVMGLCGNSADDFWAVGIGDIHFNHESWIIRRSNRLNIACALTSGGDLWAVTSNGGVLRRQR